MTLWAHWLARWLVLPACLHVAPVASLTARDPQRSPAWTTVVAKNIGRQLHGVSLASVRRGRGLALSVRF
jgi:hypothetical protein